MLANTKPTKYLTKQNIRRELARDRASASCQAKLFGEQFQRNVVEMLGSSVDVGEALCAARRHAARGP